MVKYTDRFCVRPVLLSFSATLELTVADQLKHRGMEQYTIRKMCGVRLIDRILSGVLRERVDIFVKKEDILVHGRLLWYGHIL